MRHDRSRFSLAALLVAGFLAAGLLSIASARADNDYEEADEDAPIKITALANCVQERSPKSGAATARKDCSCMMDRIERGLGGREKAAFTLPQSSPAVTPQAITTLMTRIRADMPEAARACGVK